MKKFIFATVCIMFFVLLSASETGFKGIHQIEWEAHLLDADQQIFQKVTNIDILPLQVRSGEEPGLTHAVFGYLPDWKRNSAPPYFDYSVLSHIALFDFTVSTAGTISGYPAGWPGDWVNTMNTAHANDVKLIMCVVEFDDDNIHAIINSSTASQTFYEEVESIINLYSLDGVNIDFEGPQTADRGAPMNSFMQGLTNYIHTHIGPEQEISFAGPAVNWSSWDLPGLVDACDYVFIMGYAYWWNSSSSTGPCAPITGSTYNLVQTLISTDRGYGGCDKSKLILGLPYYGNRWEVSYSQHATENATTLNLPGSSIVYASARDKFITYGKQWSSRYEDTWTYYQSDEKWYQAWCNDAESLDAKEKLVFSHNLMGTGMWALGYDEEHTELWQILRDNFYNIPDSLLIDNFETGFDHFYRQPAYSGSTHGICDSSFIDTTREEAFQDQHSLKIVFKDDTETDEDWKVRLLSGGGTPANNIRIPRDREIRFALKTGQAGAEIAVLIDDVGYEMEVSYRQSIPGDNCWHTYSVFLDSAEMWENYSNGNGSIDADYVTLDALLFYAPNQSQDRIFYLDALQSISSFESALPNIIAHSEQYHLFPNYPNPFNAHTVLRYQLSVQGEVSISVYNISGQHISTLVDGQHTAGKYTVDWNSKAQSSGMYIAVMYINGVPHASQKLMLLK